ncbi:MAG: LysM peptidoglycan-binding domain-containing M23 family metallopeptidase [Thermodesulfobacteriota bacterium]
MGGKPNEKILLMLFFVSAVFVLSACARTKAPIEKRITPQEMRGVYHVVERHQTFYRICKTYSADLNEVASLNRIPDPSKIKTGQRIFIPRAKRILKVEIYIDDVVSEQGEKTKVAYKKFDFIWPVEGKINQGFEEAENRRHQGIDISSAVGSPIKASNAGTVIYSNNTITGYGNLIILRHSEELVTVYAHNQVNLVEEGTWVEKGQVIGKVGQTGRTSGPHLHFEIRKNNKAMDPLLFLK